jgi:hypothetical protein
VNNAPSYPTYDVIILINKNDAAPVLMQFPASQSPIKPAIPLLCILLCVEGRVSMAELQDCTITVPFLLSVAVSHRCLNSDLKYLVHAIVLFS